MFKSASTSRIQPELGSSSNFKFSAQGHYDLTASCAPKSKKYGVKFQVEKDKENSTSKQTLGVKTGDFKRNQRPLRTWTQKLIQHTDADQQSIHEKQTNEMETSHNYLRTTLEVPKYTADDTPSPSTHLQVKGGLSKMTKQCRSMRTLPNYEPEQTLIVKGGKRYQKLEAYNELLKSSEELINRYKRMEDEKTKLRSDFKSQVDHSKSSKKIMFTDDTKAVRNQLQSTKKDYQSGLHPYSKPSALSTYQPATKKHQYGQYNIKVSSKYGKFDSNSPSIMKAPAGTSMNKTFSSKSLRHEEPSQKYQLSSCTDGFGLDRSLKKDASTSSIIKKGGKVRLSDFELGKSVGSGAFGEVFPARHKESKMLFALKKVKKESVKHMLDQFIQEIKIQLFLDHPNIVKLYSFFDDNLHFYILMEYMEGGSLYSYLKKAKSLSIQETSEKLREACEGLKHMHQNQVLHRDIKPENIVLTHNVSKLCDFGWSAICKDRRTTYCGTLDYVCPEIIDGQGYDDSVDIWCIGVLAYELIVGKTPFYNISRKETMKKIMEVKLDYPEDMPAEAKRFVQKILKKNPDQRIDIDDVLRDPLLLLSRDTLKTCLF